LRTKPLVSIAIPAYNAQDYISQTIQSILINQSPEYDIEILVSDNGSTDSTKEILENYKKDNVKILSLSKTIDIGANWTKVCKMASGDFIKLLCADDVLIPGSIQRELQSFKGEPSLAAVISTRNITDSKGKILFSGRGFKLNSGRYAGSTLLRKSIHSGTNLFGEPGCVMFRKDVLAGALPWDNTNPFVIDLELYSRALVHREVGFSQHPVMSFRIHAGATSFKVRLSQAREFISFAESLVGKVGGINPKLLRTARVRAHLYQIGRNLIYFFVFHLSKLKTK
jgi:glycosyltransferase involved in cell wall biosynthesis